MGKDGETLDIRMDILFFFLSMAFTLYQQTRLNALAGYILAWVLGVLTGS